MQAVVRFAGGDGGIQVVVVHARVYGHGVNRAAIEQGKKLSRYIRECGRCLKRTPRQQHNVPPQLQLLARFAQDEIPPLLIHGAHKTG